MIVSEPIVKVEGLTKRYGGRVDAVRGIDFEIQPGEVFGFLGPNGAGKSTTIRCLLGLLRPTRGRIEAFGQDVTRAGVAVRARLAYVPGELRLPERLTGAQLARTIATMRGTTDPVRQAEVADRLQLDLHRPIRGLSTGNRRKLALLLAFTADAELLVLDEPTSGLDPLMQREFLTLLGEAKARGATTLLSSHVLSEVQRAADRVAVLRSGKLIAQGAVDDLRRRARQRIEVWFDAEPTAEQLRRLPSLSDVTPDGKRLTATVSGPLQPLLKELAQYPLTSMVVQEPDLEDAFLDLYTEPAAA